MKEFCTKLIKFLSLILGIALLLIGIGCLVGLAHELPKHDADLNHKSDLLLGLGFIAALSLALGALLLRIATATDLVCRPVWRALLISLGVLSVGLALGLAIRLFFDHGTEEAGFKIFFLCTVVFLPAACGYFLFKLAGNMQESLVDRQRSRVRLYLLGQVMTLCFVLAIAMYLPTAWRIAVAVLLALFFVRVHRGWSGRRFTTPLGRTSIAEIFDAIFQGMLCLAVQIFVAVLTGGIAGGGSFKGGGGSFGGGGASGKW
jgi:hypothetical protein